MNFIWPSALLLLVVVAGLAVLYVLAQRRRNRYALRYANLSLVREAIGKGPGWRRHVPPALFILALAFMAIAVARPQAVVAVPSQEGTVILAIDVSGSMLAEDMKPNRMEAAKAAARAFVDKQSESVKIGVVSFSGDASIVQSPTTDKTLVIAAINRLRPQRATAIGRAILVSLDAIAESQGSEADLPSSILQQPGQPDGSATPRPSATIPAYLAGQHAAASIVLLSDGQNNQFPAPLDIVDQASSRGVRIYTIGVGSAAGAIVRLQGRAVRTALDETTLKKIAEITDGQYFNANTEADLRAVYENLTTELVVRNEKTELTAYATLAAAVLAVFAGAFSLLWFNRLP
ncbi:MAG: VWA domain-containing protein [Chloroflexi bacterium]|nr:MAG: VWA domain-containing protein [Chloroflexota bacterium]